MQTHRATLAEVANGFVCSRISRTRIHKKHWVSNKLVTCLEHQFSISSWNIATIPIHRLGSTLVTHIIPKTATTYDCVENFQTRASKCRVITSLWVVKSRANRTVSTLVGKGYSNYYTVVKELPIQNSSTKQYVLTLLVTSGSRSSQHPLLWFGSPPVYPTFYNYYWVR